MSEQKHRIKRLVIELTVSDAAEANWMSDEVSRIYRQRIVPLLDRYCSELSAPDRLYRIERLELDIGTIDAGQLERDLVAKVSTALRQALPTVIGEQERGGGGLDQRDRAISQLELFSRFASTGSLPWWADSSTPQLLESSLQYLLENAPESLRPLLREQRLLQRIVAHMPDDLLTRLAASLATGVRGLTAEQLRALLDLLGRTASAAGHPQARLRASMWCVILRISGLGGQQYSTDEAFYQAILQRVAAELGRGYATLVAALQPAALSMLEGDGAASAPAREMAQRLLDLPPAPHLLRERPNEQAARSPDPRDNVLAINDSEVDELYIGNAGLVILWPFLSNFFGRLELLEDEHFKDRAAQQRAAGLLQYIATGDVNFPEYLLPLNKLLCGLELDELFDLGEPLRDAEVVECAKLLDAAIAQAPILHDMSVPGFQGTFLLRQAVLSVRDGTWLLRVERQTYDLVLDRFPWAWEWVRLPWMDAPLRVEW